MQISKLCSRDIVSVSAGSSVSGDEPPAAIYLAGHEP